MLVIYTKMEPPPADFIQRERAAGNSVWHVPALNFRRTGIVPDLEGFDAAFVASPRAAVIAAESLAHFDGAVFAAGPGSARVLLQMGISVSAAGSGNGAEKDFPEFLKKRPVSRVAWISARETAADLRAIALQCAVSVEHFPVYETFPAAIDEGKLSKLERPVEWHFFSGKAVQAFRRFIQGGDRVKLHGASAEKAFFAEGLGLGVENQLAIGNVQ